MINHELRNILLQRLEEEVTARIGASAQDFSETDTETLISQCLHTITQGILQLDPHDEAEIVASFANNFLRLGPLEALLADARISEIMVNGSSTTDENGQHTNPRVFCEIDGRIVEYPQHLFESANQVERIINQIGQDIGRSCTSADPIMNARLRDGSRILATHQDISPDGPTITIRRFRQDILTPESLVQSGTCNAQIMHFLEACVKSRVNIFVTGGTGSGKTTLLNALSYFIPANERIVAIEDPLELQLFHDNLVRLEARPANTEGEGEITMHDLVIASLRMRPDRIIIGEVRDVAAIDMLTAMTTGHDGSLSTLHANDPLGAFGRLRTMVQTARPNMSIGAIDTQIAEAVELIIHTERDNFGQRRIVAITAIEGYSEGTIIHNTLFAYDPKFGLVPQGTQPTRIKQKILRYNSSMYDSTLFYVPEEGEWTW